MIPATKTEHTQAPSRAPRRPPARHQPTEQGGMGAFYAGGRGAAPCLAAASASSAGYNSSS